MYPFTKDFTLQSGHESLKKYMFGTKRAEHQFCGVCGSSCFLRLVEDTAPPILAVNVSTCSSHSDKLLERGKWMGGMCE